MEEPKLWSLEKAWEKDAQVSSGVWLQWFTLLALSDHTGFSGSVRQLI